MAVSTHSTVWHNLGETMPTTSWTVILGVLAFVFLMALGLSPGSSVPVAGEKYRWEPSFLVRQRFVLGAPSILSAGYKKYRDSIFKIQRNDTDILIIPNKYLDELRSSPSEDVSGSHAHAKNLMGKYTTTDILRRTQLHSHTLNKKLTPNLGSFIPAIQEELEYSLQPNMPVGEGWIELKLNEVVLQAVASISARVLVGLPVCRNPEWVRLTISFAEDVFKTIMALRFFPSALHPVVARCLPSWYRLHQAHRTARRLLRPVHQQIAEQIDCGKEFSESTVLRWMFEGAANNERNVDTLSHLELLMSMGAMHTTSMTITFALYDLCTYPECLAPLLEELEEALSESQGKWTKTAVSKVPKLESFMKESQRMNPGDLISFSRLILKPVSLSDGTVLPEGSQIAFPHVAASHDPELVRDPATFDPLRTYHLRQKPGQAGRHTYPATDRSNLHFGLGKYACPGRFFAANEIKMVLGYILQNYEFKFPEGKSRPATFTIDEFPYPDPAGTILIRQRTV